MGRVALIPALFGAFYFDKEPANWLALTIFLIAAVTDWLDGYLARRWDQGSSFGRMLDPIADKMLVAAAILMLVHFDRAPIIPSIIILCREFLVSGLREYLIQINVSLPVSQLAKWKTTVQMIALGLLILGNVPQLPLPVVAIGEVCFWIAALLTLITGYDYLRVGLSRMSDEDVG